MKLSEDQGLTRQMKIDVEKIVENAINGLSVVLNRSFIAIHQEMKNLHEELREELNKKFDYLNNRLDDTVDKKADRKELMLLEKRVTKLEK